MRFLLGDPLQELCCVVTPLFLKLQFNNKWLFSNLSMLSLWFARRQKCEHRSLLNLLHDYIIPCTILVRLAKLRVVHQLEYTGFFSIFTGFLTMYVSITLEHSRLFCDCSVVCSQLRFLKKLIIRD
jgi:hypothetical protein